MRTCSHTVLKAEVTGLQLPLDALISGNQTVQRMAHYRDKLHTVISWQDNVRENPVKDGALVQVLSGERYVLVYVHTQQEVQKIYQRDPTRERRN